MVTEKLHAILGERLAQKHSADALQSFLTATIEPHEAITGWNMLDLSYYDANKGDGTYVPVNWNMAKSSWPGAIVRAGYGVTGDAAYDEQIAAMRSASAAYGSYWYYDPSYNAITQAQKFLNIVAVNGGFGKLGAWLDLETRPSTLSASAYMSGVGSFLNEVKNALSYQGLSTLPLGIYSRNTFIDPIVQSAGAYWVSQYKYWQALYATGWSNYAQLYPQILSGYVPPKPTPSAYLGYCSMWQWTDKGQPSDVPGYPPYKKSIDFNVVYEPIPTLPPTEPAPSGGYQMKVIVNSLNVRNGPGTSYQDIGDLKLGDIVTPINTGGNDSWVEIEPGKWAAVKTNGAIFMTRV